MPTERMEEVEVVICEHFTDRFSQGTDCDDCGREYDDHKGPAIRLRKVPQGSLTAARLRLADAAEAEANFWSEVSVMAPGWDAERMRRSEEYKAALAALRTARGEG